MRKKKLETQFPGLTAIKPDETEGTATAAALGRDPRVALNEEIIKASALAAKIQVLDQQLAQLEVNTTLLTSVECEMSRLQMEKEIVAKLFDFYSTKLEDERFKEAIQGNSNISPVENK